MKETKSAGVWVKDILKSNFYTDIVFIKFDGEKALLNMIEGVPYDIIFSSGSDLKVTEENVKKIEYLDESEQPVIKESSVNNNALKDFISEVAHHLNTKGMGGCSTYRHYASEWIKDNKPVVERLLKELKSEQPVLHSKDVVDEKLNIETLVQKLSYNGFLSDRITDVDARKIISDYIQSQPIQVGEQPVSNEDEIEPERCITCGNELKSIIEIHRGTCNECEQS